MKNKRVLVIGGNGFLGTHVVLKLLKDNFKVSVIDKNFVNLNKFKSSKNLELIKGNIIDFSSLEKFFKNKDYVINFAALGDLDEALKKPLNTIEINILMNCKILEACKNQKIKKFIFASTVYVNGNHGGFYRCSKQAAESYIKEYKNTYGLNYTIIRYGSLYGIGSQINNGLRKIVESAIYKKKIIYKGPKETTREYINVIDAANATVELINKNYDNKIVNVSGNQKIKIEELLKLIAEMTGINEKKISYSKSKLYGHYLRTPYNIDLNPAIKFNHRNYIEISEGIKQLINFVNDEK